MRADKYNRMMAAYNGFKGGATVAAVEAQIPARLFDRLTGAELGAVMSAVNAAYHNGKRDAGAESIDGGGAVWVTQDGGGIMVTLDAAPGVVEVARYTGQDHETTKYARVA